MTGLICSNCGSTHLLDVALNKWECEYCGTVLAGEKRLPGPVRCPRCGLDNERGARCCTHCGAALLAWVPSGIQKMDPAVLSMIATIVGFFFISVVGGAVGLYLGYRALREARAGGGREDLARITITIGWISVGVSVMSTCLGFGVWGIGIRAGLIESL